jgi:hypothetical protein
LLFDVETGHSLRVLEGHRACVVSAAWPPISATPFRATREAAFGYGTDLTDGAQLLGAGTARFRFQRFDISPLELVNLTFASWNHIARWLRQLDELRSAA